MLLEPLIDRFQLVAKGAVVLLDLNGKTPLPLEALKMRFVHFEHGAGQWDGYETALLMIQGLADVLGQDASLSIVHDASLSWGSLETIIAAVRMPPLHGALDRLIDSVEAELGGPLPSLSRENKQRAVRLLDERGAFILRRAVEDVADAMGVSRITIYNYLNAIHR